MNIFDIAKQNQEKAWQVIKNTNIIQIWEDAGAKINLVGSLRTGLLMKHRDIDFHIYVNTQFRAYPFYKASEWMPHKKLLLNSIVF